jgi:hypothetical protein
MSGVLSICRSAVLSFEGGLACGVFHLTTGEPLAFFVRAPEVQEKCQAFVDLARSLLDRQGQQRLAEDDPAPDEALDEGEVHVASDVYGYARTLPAQGVMVVLVASRSNNVGIGWATLSTTASRVAAAL